MKQLLTCLVVFVVFLCTASVWYDKTFWVWGEQVPSWFLSLVYASKVYAMWDWLEVK